MSYESDGGRIGAVVALKAPAVAKSRLCAVLPAEQRRALYFFMAHRVLTTLLTAEAVGPVWVVTSSDEVAGFAGALGASVCRQSRDLGTAPAFAHLIEQLGAAAPPRLLMVAGDLPLISVPELSRVFMPPLAAPEVRIVPDRKRIGTNVLLCAPPAAIPPRFGDQSFQEHLAVARARSIPLTVVDSTDLSLDIDDAEDLALWRQRIGAARAATILEESDRRAARGNTHAA